MRVIDSLASFTVHVRLLVPYFILFTPSPLNRPPSWVCLNENQTSFAIGAAFSVITVSPFNSSPQVLPWLLCIWLLSTGQTTITDIVLACTLSLFGLVPLPHATLLRLEMNCWMKPVFTGWGHTEEAAWHKAYTLWCVTSFGWESSHVSLLMSPPVFTFPPCFLPLAWMSSLSLSSSWQCLIGAWRC